MMVTPVTGKDDSFWKEIEREFYSICHEVDDFKFPTREEIENMQLSIQSNGAIKFQDRDSYFVLTDNRLIKMLPCMLALGVKVPEYLLENAIVKLNMVENLREKISNVIASQSSKIDLFLLWGDFNRTYQNFLNLACADNAEANERANSYNRKSMPHVIERYLFACGMHRFRIVEGKSREDALGSLYEEIEIILNSEREFPTYISEALIRLCENGEIKQTYKKVTKEDVLRMYKRTRDNNYPFDIFK